MFARRLLQILLPIFFGMSLCHAVDRLYTADEVSNTVSVIDPNDDSFVGVIYLGNPRPLSYSAFTTSNNQINVHGIDFSPVKKMLAVTSNITNSVSLIRLESDAPFDFVPVGRSPHTSNFSPDGTEVWSNIRGQDHVAIIDTKQKRVLQKLKTDHSPSFTAFLKNKPIALVSHGFSKSVQVFNWKTRKKIKDIPMRGWMGVVAQFNSNQSELWVLQKDIDSVARIDTNKLEVIEYIPTGSYTQHIAFFKKDGIEYAMITVGGEDCVKIYQIKEGKAIEIQRFDVAGVPHSLLASQDGKKIFVATEHGDTLQIFSTLDYKLIKTLKIGASPQAMVMATGLDASKLEEFEKKNIKKLAFGAINEPTRVESVSKKSGQSGSIAVRRFSHVDFFIFQLFGMSDNDSTYAVYLRTNSNPEWTEQELIGMIKCHKILTCIDYASYPIDDGRIDRLAKKSIGIVDMNSKELKFEVKR